jgi:hypothetical protein
MRAVEASTFWLRKEGRDRDRARLGLGRDAPAGGEKARDTTASCSGVK